MTWRGKCQLMRIWTLTGHVKPGGPDAQLGYTSAGQLRVLAIHYPLRKEDSVIYRLPEQTLASFTVSVRW
jgi:hypothetical protein